MFDFSCVFKLEIEFTDNIVDHLVSLPVLMDAFEMISALYVQAKILILAAANLARIVFFVWHWSFKLTHCFGFFFGNFIQYVVIIFCLMLFITRHYLLLVIFPRQFANKYRDISRNSVVVNELWNRLLHSVVM